MFLSHVTLIGDLFRIFLILYIFSFQFIEIDSGWGKNKVGKVPHFASFYNFFLHNS